jgi:hypothetical protein
VGESNEGVATNRLLNFDGEWSIFFTLLDGLSNATEESPIAKSRNGQLGKDGKSLVEQIDGRSLEAYVSGNGVRVGGLWWGVGGQLNHGQRRLGWAQKVGFLGDGNLWRLEIGLEMNSNFPRPKSPH